MHCFIAYTFRPKKAAFRGSFFSFRNRAQITHASRVPSCFGRCSPFHPRTTTLSHMAMLYLLSLLPLALAGGTATLTPTTDYSPAILISSLASSLPENTYVLRSHSTNLYLGYNTTSTSINAYPGTVDTWGWMVGQANWDDSDGFVNGESTVIGSNKKRSLASGSPVSCGLGIN
jgi:hypothetical protein